MCAFTPAHVVGFNHAQGTFSKGHLRLVAGEGGRGGGFIFFVVSDERCGDVLPAGRRMDKIGCLLDGGFWGNIEPF